MGIVVSSVDLLLEYCKRFYGRQLITRKEANTSIVATIENALKAFFANKGISELPTVKYLAAQVHLSSGYLSDILKKETGRNAQDLIHYYLIEEAKTRLLNSNLNINEIAYAMGFEYPQYFNKLFKLKTGKTPVEYRNLN